MCDNSGDLYLVGAHAEVTRRVFTFCGVYIIYVYIYIYIRVLSSTLAFTIFLRFLSVIIVEKIGRIRATIDEY